MDMDIDELGWGGSNNGNGRHKKDPKGCGVAVALLPFLLIRAAIKKVIS